MCIRDRRRFILTPARAMQPVSQFPFTLLIRRAADLLQKRCAVLACLRSAAVFGIEAFPVHVEVDVTFGLPSFTLVGLPDPSVRESRDRVRSAIRNSGFDFPPHRITVNLAPADVRKAGSSFDLPIALGILAATGIVERRRVDDICLLYTSDAADDLL